MRVPTSASFFWYARQFLKWRHSLIMLSSCWQKSLLICMSLVHTNSTMRIFQLTDWFCIADKRNKILRNSIFYVWTWPSILSRPEHDTSNWQFDILPLSAVYHIKPALGPRKLSTCRLLTWYFFWGWPASSGYRVPTSRLPNFPGT